MLLCAVINATSTGMSDLRRSDRVREHGKPDEFADGYAANDQQQQPVFQKIRPREWHKVQKRVGTFKVKVWIPKSQVQPTAALQAQVKQQLEAAKGGKKKKKAPKVPQRRSQRAKAVLTPLVDRDDDDEWLDDGTDRY